MSLAAPLAPEAVAVRAAGVPLELIGCEAELDAALAEQWPELAAQLAYLKPNARLERAFGGAPDQTRFTAAAELLARGTPALPSALPALFGAAHARPGAAPLVLVEVTLAPAFDPVKRLSEVALAATVHGRDPRQREAAAQAHAALAEARSVGARSAVAAAAPWLWPALRGDERLDARAAQALLAARGFEVRRLFGAPHVRALAYEGAREGRSEAVLATYIPETLARRLPLARATRARIVAELWAAQAHDDPGALCLRVLAAGRVLAAPASSAART